MAKKSPVFPQLERLSRYGRPRGYVDDPRLVPVDKAIQIPEPPITREENE